MSSGGVVYKTVCILYINTYYRYTIINISTGATVLRRAVKNTNISGLSGY